MILHVTFLYVYVFDEKNHFGMTGEFVSLFYYCFFLFVRRGVLTIQNGVLKTF